MAGPFLAAALGAAGSSFGTAVGSSLGTVLPAAALGAGSSLLSFSGNKRQIRHQLAANKELADYQMQQNIQLWNMQNAYNTPAAQMHRYQEAGLNPNLVATQGNSGNAGAVTPYQAPTVDRAEMNFQNFLDSIMKASSIKNMDKQNDKLGKEIDALEINNQRAAGEYNEWLSTASHREMLRNNQIEMEANDIALQQLRYDREVLGINQSAQKFEDYKKEAKLRLESMEIDNRIKKATEDFIISKTLSEANIAANQAEASQYLSDSARADVANAWLDYEAGKIANKTAEYNRDMARYSRDEAAYYDYLRVKHLPENEDNYVYNLKRNEKNDTLDRRVRIIQGAANMALGFGAAMYARGGKKKGSGVTLTSPTRDEIYKYNNIR